MKITWECPVMRRVIWTENWIMRVEIQGKRFIYLRTCGDASATQLKIWSWNARKYSSGCLRTFHFLPVSWNVSINSHLRVKSFFLGDFRSSDAKYSEYLGAARDGSGFLCHVAMAIIVGRQASLYKFITNVSFYLFLSNFQVILFMK